MPLRDSPVYHYGPQKYRFEERDGADLDRDAIGTTRREMGFDGRRGRKIPGEFDGYGKPLDGHPEKYNQSMSKEHPRTDFAAAFAPRLQAAVTPQGVKPSSAPAARPNTGGGVVTPAMNAQGVGAGTRKTLDGRTETQDPATGRWVQSTGGWWNADAGSPAIQSMLDSAAMSNTHAPTTVQTSREEAFGIAKKYGDKSGGSLKIPRGPGMEIVRMPDEQGPTPSGKTVDVAGPVSPTIARTPTPTPASPAPKAVRTPSRAEQQGRAAGQQAKSVGAKLLAPIQDAGTIISEGARDARDAVMGFFGAEPPARQPASPMRTPKYWSDPPDFPAGYKPKNTLFPGDTGYVPPAPVAAPSASINSDMAKFLGQAAAAAELPKIASGQAFDLPRTTYEDGQFRQPFDSNKDIDGNLRPPYWRGQMNERAGVKVADPFKMPGRFTKSDGRPEFSGF